ncbi:MAG: type IV pili methyl-accepting chemotaxis transducer N-terminal domain-containing protein [Candidatus Accumulibacter sp.]|jgi:nitrate/nitrite-specific signal transduction histidine kinase|uniref:type IV pili methyl-accepting chemotaxis transducer N-terminal domain-containing protein n=1 Tax=Accumulibacter sp. TaxID=2053492 RepID=UPI001A3A4D05|nr:type IV pili methyl-accepting chemotaxis transducer N-terminal domain-containing protein [Accumulibacter sp.]MBL8393830.1 type IV pili methyl-accepting chemotaxis transducer N-terminal domain-containing protein [Accumulibacter sp.]
MLKPVSVGRVLLALLLFSLLPIAQAQISDLNSAINKAGRQRMLSQRMAKAYFQIGLGVDTDRSRRILDSSVGLFDRQLAELKTYAPAPEIRETYLKLDKLWQVYRSALTTAVPNQAEGARILALSDEALSLAQQGTQQLESRSTTATARLVNIAGRQRMLSQRMAKFYQATAWQVGVEQAGAQIDQARREFSAALSELGAAPGNTPALRDDLELVRQQWLFFENALGQPPDSSKRRATTVATTSERILETMESIVTQYEKLPR